MRLTITGDEHLKALLAKDQLPGLARALHVEAERIMTSAKRLAPVDKGTLRASGHVEDPIRFGKFVTVTLGFGGAASAYALVQHERLDYRHTVGQAKYLEQPMREAEGGLAARLGAHLDLF